MIHYILQIIAFQLFFLLIYDLFLKKETFFNWNRGYLLITSILSFVLPLVKIKALQQSIPQKFIINLPEVVITSKNDELVNTILLDTIYITDTSVSYVQWIFYIGFGVSILLFTIKLLKICKLIYGNPKVNKKGFRLVNLGKSKAAFSFLNYIFIGEKIEDAEAFQILEHEKIHVAQKHTLDLLYFEILRILFWFNPLIYIYQNRITELHEFIADSKAIKQHSKSHYYQNLLSQIFDTNKVSFINTFFKQSLIKKRIIMLSKQKSKQILKLKYALLIPLVFGMLVYTSCTQEIENKDLNLSQYTIVKSLKDFKDGSNEEVNELMNFLDKNPEYTTWNLIDLDNQEVTISVHSKDEVPPEGYTKMNGFTDETKDRIGYIKFKGAKHSIDKLSNDREDFLETQEVPFAVIDQVPVFPGCESGTQKEQKQCISKKVSQIVGQNFNTKIADDLGLTGRQTIYVGFKIDKQGNIIDVKARAPHKVLEEEAKRVIKLLPKMKPGTHEGKAVNVPYSLPIVFQIHE